MTVSLISLFNPQLREKVPRDILNVYVWYFVAL